MQETRRTTGIVINDSDSPAHSPWLHLEHDPELELIRRYVDGQWLPVTAREFCADIAAVARGLIAHEVRPGDRVALMAETSYEWTVLDYAIWAAGAASVPVYPTSSTEQCDWILTDSGAVAFIADLAARAPGLEPPATCAHKWVLEDGAIAHLKAAGADIPEAAVQERLAGLRADDLASLVYTSGTTGRPKGCELTHRNFMAEMLGLLEHPIGQVARKGNRTLMFLPLAHVLARAVNLAALHAGTTVGHWGDFSTIVTQFGVFKPHLVLGVPRVFEKVRDGAAAKAAAGGKLKGKIFALAAAAGVEHSRAQDTDRGPGPLLRAERAVADRLVFSQLRAALGGECQYAISGGGALMPEIGHFFRAVGVPIYEGYGLTETTAAHTVNGPGLNRIGSVGVPVADFGVRLAEDGEILLEGDNVFRGYWNNEQATSEAFVDGWFRSGDLGAIDAEGFLSIVGRKKDLLVTAGGKNVSPGPIEDRLRSHPLISQAVVIGDGRKFVSALITLDEAELATFAHGQGLAGATPRELAQNPAVRARVQAAVDDANAQVSHSEGIKKFVILPEDLTEEGGELTATLKVKRKVVNEKYAAEIDSIYR